MISRWIAYGLPEYDEVTNLKLFKHYDEIVKMHIALSDKYQIKEIYSDFGGTLIASVARVFSGLKEKGVEDRFDDQIVINIMHNGFLPLYKSAKENVEPYLNNLVDVEYQKV